MPRRVKDAQQDQPSSPENGKRNSQTTQDLLAARGVGDQTTAVPQPAVGGKRQVEEDGGEHAARDEQRLEVVGADVADVGDGLRVRHGPVVHAVLVDDPVEEQRQEGSEPDDARDDGGDLGGEGQSGGGHNRMWEEKEGIPNMTGGP